MPRRKPPITTALVAINLAVFLAMVLAGVSPTTPSTAQLLKWGANWGPLSLGPQPWRMLASNYLHGGILHIGFNMWCLWNLGYLAESVFEPWTFILVYTVSGLGGSLASLWWHPLAVGVGASGAIFGLAGALIAALYLGHLPIPKEAVRGTMKSLLTFAAYNLFFGAVGRGIDNSAHIGGLLAGGLLGALLAKHLVASPEVRSQWRSAALVASALLLFVAFGMVRRTGAYVVPLEEGMQALQKGKFAAAASALESADARKPNNHDTLFLLASAYLQEADYAKAESTLQQVVKLDPADADARFNLGLAQLKLGRFDEAIASLKLADQLNPRDADVQQALGEAYQGKGMPEEARAALQKSAELRNATKH